jgi:hypothetical protein
MGAVGTVRVLAVTLSLIGKHAALVNSILSIKQLKAHTYNILRKPIHHLAVG